jgi:hypothetical protein
MKKTHSLKDLTLPQREPAGENRPVPALGKPVEVIPIEEFIEMYIRPGRKLNPIEKMIVRNLEVGNESRLCINLGPMRAGKSNAVSFKVALQAGLRSGKISPEDLKDMIEKG